MPRSQLSLKLRNFCISIQIKTPAQPAATAAKASHSPVVLRTDSSQSSVLVIAEGLFALCHEAGVITIPGARRPLLYRRLHIRLDQVKNRVVVRHVRAHGDD